MIGKQPTGKEEKKWIFSRNVFSILLVLFVVIVVVVVLLFAVFLLVKFQNNNKEDDSVDEYYRYLQWNHEKNESFFGLVTSPTYLESQESISFLSFQMENDENTHILISKFGDEQYQCTGYCSCEKNEKSSSRRTPSSTSTMSRGLLYFVAAASSLLAVQIARNHFHDTCSAEMSEYCEESGSYIHSEVEECTPIVDVFAEKDKELIHIGPSVEVLGDDEDIGGEMRQTRPVEGDKRTEYFCTGGCVIRDIWADLQSIKNGKSLASGKSDLKKELLIVSKEIDQKYLESRIKICERMRLALFVLSEGEDVWEARAEFVEKSLEPFCRENTHLPQYWMHWEALEKTWCEPDTSMYTRKTSTTFCRVVDDELFEEFLKNLGRKVY